ncbi:hypothetical protein [Longitalea arenae]|nr:hypothetical protein [Longitalea arenae]
MNESGFRYPFVKWVVVSAALNVLKPATGDWYLVTGNWQPATGTW